jgi:hypothetical protein
MAGVTVGSYIVAVNDYAAVSKVNIVAALKDANTCPSPSVAFSFSNVPIKVIQARRLLRSAKAQLRPVSEPEPEPEPAVHQSYAM